MNIFILGVKTRETVESWFFEQWNNALAVHCNQSVEICTTQATEWLLSEDEMKRIARYGVIKNASQEDQQKVSLNIVSAKEWKVKILYN